MPKKLELIPKQRCKTCGHPTWHCLQCNRILKWIHRPSSGGWIQKCDHCNWYKHHHHDFERRHGRKRYVGEKAGD